MYLSESVGEAMSGQPGRYWSNETAGLDRYLVDASAFDAQAKECERLREALESCDRFIKVVAMLELKPDQHKAVRDQLAVIDRALHGERGA